VRPFRLGIVSLAVLPLVFLAACSSGPTSALDTVNVGGTDKAPTVTFKTKPLKVKVTTTKVVTPGKGAKLTKANAITFNYILFNGKDGKPIESSFGTGAAPLDLSSTSLLPGLTKSLTGKQVGSRLLVAIPPVDAFGTQGNAKAGFGPADTVVFFIQLVSSSTPLTTATGAEVPPVAGLPTVTMDGKKAANITVPKTAAPTKLIVQPLIKGAGAVVKAGQNIKVSYTGVLWKDGKKFDASADHGGSTDFQIGAGKVIPGWDKGLVGQTVGSRLLLVVPPAEGYGSKGSPPIGPTDTMVFVIDILAVV